MSNFFPLTRIQTITSCRNNEYAVIRIPDVLMRTIIIFDKLAVEFLTRYYNMYILETIF